MSAVRKIRLELARNDVVVLIWAIDDLEETYAYDGGTKLMEDELRVRDYLQDRLDAYDKRRIKVPS